MPTIAIEEVLRESTKVARECLPGCKSIVPFPTFGYTDVWLDWFAQTRKRVQPRVVFILQDWGNEDDWKHDIGKYGKVDSVVGAYVNDEVADKTCGTFLRCVSQKLPEGAWLVMNAVWALRAKDAAVTGYLGSKVHASAFPVWCSLLSQFAGGTLTTVCFCGDWARWKQWPFGTNEDLATVVDAWKSWSRRYASREARIRVEGVDSSRFSGMKCLFAPHPSAWTWNFESAVAEIR